MEHDPVAPSPPLPPFPLQEHSSTALQEHSSTALQEHPSTALQEHSSKTLLRKRSQSSHDSKSVVGQHQRKKQRAFNEDHPGVNLPIVDTLKELDRQNREAAGQTFGITLGAPQDKAFAEAYASEYDEINDEDLVEAEQYLAGCSAEELQEVRQFATSSDCQLQDLRGVCIHMQRSMRALC